MTTLTPSSPHASAPFAAGHSTSALPPPVARFREVALRDAPGDVKTVVIETKGTMRRAGMPPIPLRIRMFHRLGHDFVHDIRLGSGRLSFRLGMMPTSTVAD